VHHFDSWVKGDQLDVTCFIISLFNAQHASDVNTFILRSLRFICWVISWVVLLWFDVCWCYVVVWLWWCGIRMQVEALVPQPAYGYHRMDVLTSETCWKLSKDIIKQVTSSSSLFTQLSTESLFNSVRTQQILYYQAINLVTCFGSLSHHQASSQTIMEVPSVDVHIVRSHNLLNTSTNCSISYQAIWSIIY